MFKEVSQNQEKVLRMKYFHDFIDQLRRNRINESLERLQNTKKVGNFIQTEEKAIFIDEEKIQRAVDKSIINPKQYKKCIENGLPDIVCSKIIRQTLFDFIENYPYRQNNTNQQLKPSSFILFYGPPGNGKSKIAEQYAKILKYNYFQIDYSTVEQLNPEWQDMITTIFMRAQKNKPSIIFIDEIEKSTICQNLCIYNIQNHIQYQTNEDFGVFVMATTSSPWMLTHQLRGKIGLSFYVGLPLKKQRIEILRMSIKQLTKNSKIIEWRCSENILKTVAEMTQGWSGKDLRNLVKKVMAKIMKLDHSSTKQQNSMLWLLQPTLVFQMKFQDYEVEILSIKCSVSSDCIQKYQQFTEELMKMAQK